MAKWIEYLLKKKPADEDMLMLEDAETHNNKRVSFSGIADWLIEKMKKNNLISGALRFKGSSAYAALPGKGAAENDYYYCTDGDGTHGPGYYAWNGSSWIWIGNNDKGIDKSLKVEGAAAEAAATGEAIASLEEDIDNKSKYVPVDKKRIDIFDFPNLQDDSLLLKRSWIYSSGIIESYDKTDVSDYLAVPPHKSIYLCSLYDSTGKYINRSVRESCIFDKDFKPIDKTADNIWKYDNTTDNIQYLRVNFNTNNSNFATIIPTDYEDSPPFNKGYIKEELIPTIPYEKISQDGVPSYYENEINKTISDASSYIWNNDNQCNDCNVLVFVTDHHIEQSSCIHGELIKRIDSVMHLDSVVNGGDNYTKNESQHIFYEEQRKAINLLNCVEDKLYNVMGNHDATNIAYGYGYTAFHKNVLISNAMKKECTFMGEQVGNPSRWLAYYRDDNVSKIRYLYLDNCYDMENRFNQNDFDWIVNTLITTPKDYHVAIFMHNPGAFEDYPLTIPDNVKINGQTLFYKMLRAYNDKKNFEYTDSSGKSTVTVTQDFSESGRAIIGVFAGHMHYDMLFKQEGINVSITTCSMLNGYHVVDGGLMSDNRINGTANDTALDLIVINKNKKEVKMFRCGYGDDRTFMY